ncbi:MAG: glycosyltransferase family 1 protein [Pedobacter sp.]|nr:MAG: glycosyltransferase family 1 protein [Pedobacter sp.]
MTEHLRFFVWKQITLPLKALMNGCDIVFCTDFFVPYINLNFKTIPVFHDAFFWEYPEHYNKYWLKIFYTFGVGAAKKSAFISTPTDYAKERVLFFLPVTPEKIITVFEAPKTLIKNESLSTGKINLNTKKYFLHIGTFEKRKNLVCLVEALHLLRLEGFTDYSLILCGQISPKNDMDGSAELLETIRKYNLQEYVLMPGYVEDGDLSWYYRNAELYLFPSVNEGFGLPVLEAFQNDLPVLVADNTCLPEVGGDAVLSFNPYNPTDLTTKLKQVISNPEIKLRLINKGRKRLENFSWEKTANHFLEIFKKVKH